MSSLNSKTVVARFVGVTAYEEINRSMFDASHEAVEHEVLEATLRVVNGASFFAAHDVGHRSVGAAMWSLRE